MKKYLILLLSFFMFINVSARTADVYLFYGRECPHCAAFEKFAEENKDKYNFNVISYETWYDEENSELLNKVIERFGDTKAGVPYIVIGNQRIIGWNDSKIDMFLSIVKKNRQKEYCSIVLDVINGTNECEVGTSLDGKVEIPIIGYVEPEEASLGLIAVIIGLVDGFNPCAMWVLLFLLSILINMKDRKRMWVIGFSFLITSALVYLLIMGSWITVVSKMSDIIILRNIIALIALVGGIYNLYNFFKPSPTGCNVTGDTKRKKIMDRIKEFCFQKNFFLALLGSICLAVSVNIVELACSAGLPIVFTEILSLNNLSGFEHFIYLLIYVFFFMLDDFVIFIIAMFTMKLTGISNKYSKYSHLIGGIIMVIVGILLIFKPEWIMFNF